MTSPMTLNYTVNSPSGDNPYTYQVVGPNNAMTSTATVLDQNWHHAALVVNGNNEQLYLDGLLVGAAQASDHYSLGFTNAAEQSVRRSHRGGIPRGYRRPAADLRHRAAAGGKLSRGLHRPPQ